MVKRTWPVVAGEREKKDWVDQVHGGESRSEEVYVKGGR
jgi:hypothetical protein